MNPITVILPVYNVEKYISKCLDSIINQSLQNFDLIIIDDCGMDNSIKVIFISDQTGEGSQFIKGFGGLVGWLRYEINRMYDEEELEFLSDDDIYEN